MKPLKKSKTANAMRTAKKRNIARLSTEERMKLALYLGHRRKEWQATFKVKKDSDG